MRRRLGFQNLERRQLLAADFDTGVEPPSATESEPAVVFASLAEGEQTADLVAFAQALGDAGVIFYGANWCPACSAQKQLFEDGGNELPFIEVTGPDRTLNEIGIEEQINAFPTWEFPDGRREVGVLSLAQLSEMSGVAIPQGDTPTFETIGNQTVQIGSPLHVPVDAYDPDGQPLTVTVTVDDPSLLDVVVTEGNRSIRIDMETYGDMVFELFEQRVPITTARIIELAESGFYDGIIFHRILPSFVIQAGDPTGTGSGGSSLDDFDDEFHRDLQHNRSGVISFAKAGDDTNNSQFFIPEAATRFLDFNHAVFGQLVEGEDVREAISQHDRDLRDKPTIPIAINTIEVFQDNENSVMMLKPTGNGTGTTKVTVTVTDSDGNTFTEVIDVDVVDDTANSQPFLDILPSTIVTPVNRPAQLQLSSVDIEGDDAAYFATSRSSASDATVEVDSATGVVTVTPAESFVGAIDVLVGVQPGPGVVGNSPSDFDSQRVTFHFGESSEPSDGSIDLLTSSDSGLFDNDNLTNRRTLDFVVRGVKAGASVELVVDQTVVASGSATGPVITLTTDQIAELGDGTYEVIARQTLEGTTSTLAQMNVVYDSIAPAALTDTGATRQVDGESYLEDLSHIEEGQGLRYSLGFAPPGATINSVSGIITWTLTESHSEPQTFVVELTDAAGNVRVESFTVAVNVTPLVEIQLKLVDAEGNALTTLEAGETFWIQMIAVDARERFDRDGVFAAAADITFDDKLVRPSSVEGITYHDPFTVATSGAFAKGLIDELGAASDELAATSRVDSLIASVPMVAVSAGTAQIQSDPADTIAGEVLLYGRDDEVPTGLVSYGDATLQITASLHRDDNPSDVNGDGEVTAGDALAILNAINRTGGTFLVSSIPADSFDPEMKYDVVPDGRISPLDALNVINALNKEEPTFERESLAASDGAIDVAIRQRTDFANATNPRELAVSQTDEHSSIAWLNGHNIETKTDPVEIDSSDSADASRVSTLDPQLTDDLIAGFDAGWLEG